MQRYSFKVLSSKEIIHLLGLLQVPNLSQEALEKPTSEFAATVYQKIAEFAFDIDVQEVKIQGDVANMVHPYIEIFDEAVDSLTIFKLVKQLALLNGLEDFNMKDIWEPQSKRFRAALSGIINFCRYKDAKTNVVEHKKAEVKALDNERLELVAKSNEVEQELSEAEARHSAELPERWRIDEDVKDARSKVEKLQKLRHNGDRVQEDLESKKQVAKERLASHERRSEELRKQIENLKEQVAESPEGLEQEIQELQHSIKQQKARVEEKGDEKRSRQQCVQARTRVHAQMEQYGRILEKVGQAAQQKATACERIRASQHELTTLRKRCEATRAELVDCQQGIQQVTAEMDAAKEAHSEQLHQFEQRRQQAMVQLQELQSKRTEEQRQADMLEQRRLELVGEMNDLRRAHDQGIADLQERLRRVKDDDTTYMQTIDGLLANYDAEFGRSSSGGGCRMTSPSQARGQLYRAPIGSKDGLTNSCSPGVSKAARFPAALVAPRRLGYGA